MGVGLQVGMHFLQVLLQVGVAVGVVICGMAPP